MKEKASPFREDKFQNEQLFGPFRRVALLQQYLCSTENWTMSYIDVAIAH